MGRSPLRFVIIFALCLTVFGIAYVIIRDGKVLVPFLAFNGEMACTIINLLGGTAEANGVLISSGHHFFQVIAECTSLVPTAILASAMLAWKSSVKEKLIGFAIGSVALFLINTGRIISLIYVASEFPGLLDIAHFFLWPFLLILMTVALWLLWAEKIVNTPNNTRRAH